MKRVIYAVTIIVIMLSCISCAITSKRKKTRSVFWDGIVQSARSGYYASFPVWQPPGNTQMQ
ncbi:MAG: hypothetical protein E3J94_03870 [Desulfobacteraceae bacterium]|nr:MAG: hypothetical protein E3J94_03870 [Desulfobacteraceae bacterium]